MFSNYLQIRILVLIWFALGLTGCAQVEWREGSIFESDRVVAAPSATKALQPAQETESPEKEKSPPSPKRGNLPEVVTPKPYPNEEQDPALQSKLSNVLSRIKSQKLSLQQQESEFKYLTEQHPHSSGFYYHLARVQFALGKHDHAINTLEHALSLSEQNFYAHNLLGLIYRDKGEFKAARQHYMAAVKIWPHYSTAWYNLGILEDVYTNNLDAAIAAYENFLAIQDSNPSTDEQTTKRVSLWVKDLQNRLKAGINQ